jgi:integrase/recombinase XerD
MAVDWASYHQRFEDYLKGEKRTEGTIDTYHRIMKKAFAYSEQQQIIPEQWMQEFLDKYKIELAKLGVNSMITHIAAVNVFCKEILKNKELRLKPPRKVIKNTFPLTPDEVERMFLSAKNNSMDYALLVLLYYSQLRRLEITRLNLDDIDFEQGRIRVNNGKGQDYSIINLHPIALEAVQKYVLNHRFEPKDGSNALFVSREYRRISKGILWERVKEYGVRAGITKRVYPHLFRHSSITHMAEAGAKLSQIQKQSRHRDIKTLMRYVHISEDNARDAYMKTMPILGQKHGYSIPKSKIGVEPLINELEPKQQLSASFENLDERKLNLVDMLVAGKISESTYNLANTQLETLREKYSQIQGTVPIFNRT